MNLSVDLYFWKTSDFQRARNLNTFDRENKCTSQSANPVMRDILNKVSKVIQNRIEP